jgi:hypothetical protein
MATIMAPSWLNVSTVMDVYLEGHYHRHWKCPLILEMLNNSHWWLKKKKSRPACVHLPKVNFAFLVIAVVVWCCDTSYDRAVEWFYVFVLHVRSQQVSA